MGQSHCAERCESGSDRPARGREKEGRRGRKVAFKASARNVERVCSIYAAHCLCGWTEQRANQMCYVYGVKARLLSEYVRTLSLTLSRTFIPLSTVISYLLSDSEALEGHVNISWNDRVTHRREIL